MIFQYQYQREVKMYFSLFLFVILRLVYFEVYIYIQYLLDVMRNKLPKLIKRRSRVQEKNMSCEFTLNFDQWKTFSKNYQPMRVWL